MPLIPLEGKVMPELTGHAVNCLVVGHERFSRPDGQTVHGLRVQLGRWPVTILQVGRPIGQSVNDFRGACVDTTEIVVERVSERSRSTAEGIVDDICFLLSFAGLSQVRAHSYTFDGRTHGHSIIAEGSFFRPLIDIHCGEDVKEYLESCWPEFRRLKRSRRLPAVVNYLVAADLHHTIQVKLLLVFTALESLKATYASQAGIPFSRGRFRKPGKNPKKAPPYGLRELADQMLRDVGMRRGLIRAVRLRDAIVHTGLTRQKLPQLNKWYDWSQSLLQEYLLRLLRHRGAYFDYATREEKRL